MSQVYYRTYRPGNFSEVVNQEAIKTTLKNAVFAGAVAHAYLFTGPRGVGKTSLARILAKAVNCLGSDLSSPRQARGTLPSKGESRRAQASPDSLGEPDGTCDNCVAISEGRFLDLIEIDAASHTGVDNIREIIEHVKFSPSLGRFKVIVIDEVHMLSKGAFNALLKTLEEPPAHALFILATTEITKVPATIISRTQRFDFKKLSQSDIVERLASVSKQEQLSMPKEVLKLVARASEGSMRDSLSLLDQLSSFAEGKITLEQAEDILGLTSLGEQQDFLTMISEQNIAQSIRFLKDLVEKGRDITQFSNGFLEYLDTVIGFTYQINTKDSLGLTAEDFETLQKHAIIPREDLVRLTELFLSAGQKIKYSPIAELPLELAVIHFFEGDTSRMPPQAPARASEKIAPEQAANAEENIKLRTAAKIEPGSEDFLPRINEKWNAYLSKVREYNHSLISSLKLASLVASDGKSLVVAFPYRFHKETVEQRKNKIVLEKVLEEVYGHALKLICIMTFEADEYQTKTDAKPKNSLVDEALKVFRIEDAS